LEQFYNNVLGNGEIRVGTDDSGKALIHYTAPLFGGSIEFIVRSITDTSLIPRYALTVRVPEMVQLPPGTRNPVGKS
jgi:hypothetical protein